MGQDDIQPKLASPGKVVPPFRMRIAHYLLLTTVCVAVGSIMDSWTDWNETPDEVFWVAKLSVGITSLLFGAAFTAVLILLGRRWRFGQSELHSPGHWLLVFLAAGALIQGLTELLLAIYRSCYDSANVDFHVWNLRKLMLCSTVGVTCFVFARLIPGNLWWKSILALCGAVLLVLVPQHVLALLGTWRPWFSLAHVYASLGVSAVVLPLLLFACVSDSRRRLQRDWLHWTGVVVIATTCLGEFCFALYWLLNW